jgi:hypothetical protein
MARNVPAYEINEGNEGNEESAQRHILSFNSFISSPHNRPDARFDYMGLVLLLDRCEVANIDADGADVVSPNGVRQRYRRRLPLPDDAVPLWELGTKR